MNVTRDELATKGKLDKELKITRGSRSEGTHNDEVGTCDEVAIKMHLDA